MAYIPATSFVPHFHKADGSLAVGCILAAYQANTTTPTPFYLDAAGSPAGTSITLNDRGEPEVSGNPVVLWLNTDVVYKFILTDPEDGQQWSVDDIITPVRQATTSAPGIVQLYDDIDSDRDDLAATASAVKIVAELAQNAITIASSGLPVGAPLFWPTGTVPSELWMEEDGRSLAVDSYPELFAVLGYMYGGSGANFNMRDMRGKFPRGWDHGAGRDPDRGTRTNRGDGTTGDAVGTNQADELKSHSHQMGGITGTSMSFGGAASDVDINPPPRKQTYPTGGNETRPININGMWMMKVKSTLD